MKCVICHHGETSVGTATLTLERHGAIVFFRDVPADICDNCGEVYHSTEITRELLAQAEVAFASGVELDVRRFGKAA